MTEFRKFYCEKCNGTGKAISKINCPACHGQKKEVPATALMRKSGIREAKSVCLECFGQLVVEKLTDCPHCNGSGEREFIA
jgi:DnaJ-class molecular chaperone